MEGGGGLEPIKLSVLVCGIPERLPEGLDETGYDGALNQLLYQAKDKQVEILYLLDNRKMSVGRKRNILLSIAQGEYCAAVDDDDSVASDYIDRLLEATSSGADVIVFKQDCVRGDLGGRVEKCEYGLGFEYRAWEENGQMCWRGLPAHTMAWRTELVNQIEFPDGDFGEDVAWCKKASAVAKTEHRIESTLYTYNFSPDKSRTRGK